MHGSVRYLEVEKCVGMAHVVDCLLVLQHNRSNHSLITWGALVSISCIIESAMIDPAGSPPAMPFLNDGFIYTTHTTADARLTVNVMVPTKMDSRRAILGWYGRLVLDYMC